MEVKRHILFVIILLCQVANAQDAYHQDLLDSLQIKYDLPVGQWVFYDCSFQSSEYERVFLLEFLGWCDIYESRVESLSDGLGLIEAWRNFY